MSDHIDLMDIYKIVYPKATEKTFFPSIHGTFFKIDQMSGYKVSLIKFKRTGILSSIFSNNYVMKQ